MKLEKNNLIFLRSFSVLCSLANGLGEAWELSNWGAMNGLWLSPVGGGHTLRSGANFWEGHTYLASQKGHD